VRDAGIARQLETSFAEDLKHSTEVTYEAWKSRSLSEKILELFTLPIEEELWMCWHSACPSFIAIQFRVSRCFIASSSFSRLFIGMRRHRFLLSKFFKFVEVACGTPHGTTLARSS
jgi:hypothetical protein